MFFFAVRSKFEKRKLFHKKNVVLTKRWVHQRIEAARTLDGLL